MENRMSISSLLNPLDSAPLEATSLNDVNDIILKLAALAGHGPTLVPPGIALGLSEALSYLQSQTDVPTQVSNQASIPPPSCSPRLPSQQAEMTVSTQFLQPASTTPSPYSTPPRSSRQSSPQQVFTVDKQHSVQLNRQTILSTLYTYHDPQAYVEYPETNFGNPVGHLFRRDPKAWHVPSHDFAYSLGEPSGSTEIGKPKTCPLFKDSKGKLIPTKISHFTCQGGKACPQADIETLMEPHTSATQDAISERLANDRSLRLELSSPEYDIFRKTSALIAAIRTVGCRAVEHEETILPQSEQIFYDDIQAQIRKAQRGYKPDVDRCRGRISINYGVNEVGQEKMYLKCEHYRKESRDHYIQYLDDSYDFDYLEAHFNEDTDELDRIEQAAHVLGFGPLAECSTVANFSSQKICCPCDHRLSNGNLEQPEMVLLPCDVKYRIHEPLPEYREECPWIFITSSGVHTHPVPLSQKTPPQTRAAVNSLLERLGPDLADLTPRRLLRHSVTKDFLAENLPHVPSPTLSDLHVSLANRAHLAYFIDLARKRLYPKGTGWEGVKICKEREDSDNPYIRRIIELPAGSFAVHPEDEPVAKEDTADVRMVICMSPEGSRRLSKSQYLQSDIGFKRVVGFYEFEMACLDRDANTSVIFCRVFLNRQTAAAHERLFHEIENIVKLDTGRSLHWRHLYADAPDETDGMILQLTADQHLGQAKGFGLYLQSLAQKMNLKYDLHEPERLLSELGPYDHLHRIFRLCTVHVYRNIHDARGLTDEVRNLMRSLAAKLEQANWVKNKTDSQFAFEGICWEKSFIPLAVWKAGDNNSNLIESVHADVNREGVSCSLLGGISKGQAFDNIKMKTVLALENSGIRRSYRSGHIVENATKNLKRKYSSHHNQLSAEDSKIQAHNVRLEKARSSLHKYTAQVASFTTRVATEVCHGQRERLLVNLEKAQKSQTTAQLKYNKEVAGGLELVETGSGKIVLITA
ncbi:hypothetical protein H0H93_012315 [Arthromyces matolae]|nr:hypothetical protein H0H93_012315 [Arthromyces matolae]